MSKLTREQQEEIARCAVDFPYFCREYVKIYLPQGTNPPPGSSLTSAIIPFELFPYQVRLYEHLEDNRFTIFSKFRQGGFSTELAIYSLWRCLFRLDQRILWLAKTDREATYVCDSIIKRALEYMPDWMKGNVMKMLSSHEKKFPETDSSMFFGTPEAACGKAISLLVVDEATFIQNMDSHWKAMWPCLSTGGNAVVLSSVNKDDDWFWTMLENAKLGLNNFSVYQCQYQEHPEFSDPKWEAEMRQALGSSPGFPCSGFEREYEQKAAETVQTLNASKKASKKLWRSIFDEWEGSSGIAGESIHDG
jgi:hypothetical protein